MVLKGAFLWLLFSLSIYATAQESYNKVDSTTYNLYAAKQWKELTNYGKQNELDYYYFNVRMGEASFQLKRYLDAEKYFSKAIANNGTEYVKSYLFWTYLYMGERDLAELVFDDLEAQTQKDIGYTRETIEQVYLEGGIKSSSVDTVGTLYYGTLFLKHRIGKKVRMNYAYTPFSLKSSIFEAKNNQFNVFGSYLLNKKSVISAGGMFSRINFIENYTNEDVPTNQNFLITDEVTDGTRKFSANSYYLHYYYRMNRWKFNVNLNYTTQNVVVKNSLITKTRFRLNDFPLQDQVQTTDTTTSESALIPSVGVKYAPSFLKDRVSIGVDVFGISSSNYQDLEVVIKPSINVLITDKIWIKASYFEVSERLFSDYTTGIFYNTNQPTKRFQSTLSYMISPKFIIKGTYIYENVINNYYGFTYQLNSAFLGLQINL